MSPADDVPPPAGSVHASFGPAVPDPPATRVDDVVDVLHGVEVPDPYRWLEDGDDPEVRDWTAAQNRRTRAVLDALPGREALRARLADLLGAPMVSAARVAGERLFALERGGGRDQTVLTVRDVADDGPEGGSGDGSDDGSDSRSGGPGDGAGSRVLVDPPALVGDATAALDWYHPSRDGSLVAFGVSVGGDERSTLRVIDVATGELRDDVIEHTRAASVAWSPDGAAFAYTRYPDPRAVPPGEAGYHRTVWWHQLGDHPGHDELVYGDLPDPTAWTDVSLSLDGRWLLLHVSLGWDRTDVHLVDRTTGERRTVIEGVTARTSARVVEDRLLLHTTLDAPNGRICHAALDRPGPEAWQPVVHERPSVVLDGFAVTDRSLLVLSTRAGVSRLEHYDLHGGEHRDVPLPGPGTVGSLSGADDRDEAWFTFSSFARPPQLFRWVPDRVEPRSDPPAVVDPEAFVVERAHYPSADGTEIPLFLVRAAGTEPSPTTPAVLTGYGGFAITLSPEYSPAVVAHCEAGGLWAVAGLRGGSEHGETWHQAGMREHKHRVFEDFEAGADWLVAHGLTSRRRLAIRGGSNGGLLVGAALTRRPDLCAAVHCAVPLLDMVRYPEFLIARLWIPEYGDPAVAEEFAWLHAYSPYHHVVDGQHYPAVLLTTGGGDSRVDPAHARKMAARLQAATAGVADAGPVLLRVESAAGHGQGKPVGRQADELADALAFLHWRTGAGRA